MKPLQLHPDRLFAADADSRADGGQVEGDPRKNWRCFAENYHLFRGTPSRTSFVTAQGRPSSDCPSRSALARTEFA